MDDIQPQTTKPISDDQELAKVLAGVSADSNNLDFEETPIVPMADSSVKKDGDGPVSEADSVDKKEAPVVGYNAPGSVNPEPVAVAAAPSSDSSDLSSIKKDALTELRPLVDKLDLEPEEKFDTYLLLLRSTDDKTLIPSAHAAARNIPDETRRAQALLDVIKEIDYLSNPQQTV